MTSPVNEQPPKVTLSVCRGLITASVLVLAAVASVVPASQASTKAKTFRDAGRAIVVAVLNGNTVRLASGDTARLAGIDAPRLGQRSAIPWPHASSSRQALSQLVLNRTVRLFHAGRRADRYGRLIVHLFAGDIWVQQHLVRKGHARVRSYADNRLRIRELLAAEVGARRARLGLWAHSRYAIRSPLNVTRNLDSWQVVEGVVAAVAALRRTTYLNFGTDWRKDFTVQINAKARRLFRKAGTDLTELKGRKVRVRGWVRSRNGPLIVATHPEQLEILTKTSGKP